MFSINPGGLVGNSCNSSVYARVLCWKSAYVIYASLYRATHRQRCELSLVPHLVNIFWDFFLCSLSLYLSFFLVFFTPSLSVSVFSFTFLLHSCYSLRSFVLYFRVSAVTAEAALGLIDKALRACSFGTLVGLCFFHRKKNCKEKNCEKKCCLQKISLGLILFVPLYFVILHFPLSLSFYFYFVASLTNKDRYKWWRVCYK